MLRSGADAIESFARMASAWGAWLSNPANPAVVVFEGHSYNLESLLRQALAPYPLEQLGSWSFVLVPADDWKALLQRLGGDPVSPAFSMLDQRMTVLDSSLFVASAGRGLVPAASFR
jgi:hypothetical protein